MSTEKRLGKITAARFGYGGYQGVQFGLMLSFDGEAWGTSWANGFWTMEPSNNALWTVADQDAYFAKIVRETIDILKKAKVDSVEKLKGLPVECKFEGGMLKDWRILKEVL